MSKRTIYTLVIGGAAVIAAALIGTSILLTRDSSSKPAARPATQPVVVAGATEANRLLKGIPQDGAALGSPNAPVTLVEYADLQCPYCAQFAVEHLPAIIRDYVRPGHVRLEYRGLAFVGPDSVTALDTALAAGKQRRLWNVVETLFANQGGENSGWVTEDLLRAVGNAVPGLAVDRMLQDSTTAEIADLRSQAQSAAAIAGVNGTPTLAVGQTGGTTALVTSPDEQNVRAALDAALQG
jgi:protein-disulfide isomerase